MSRYRSVLLFGTPGVGKGTQGKLLGCIPGFHHFATGDMFRALDRSSELGRRFFEISSRGDLVPDDLTIELWRQSVEGRIASGAFRPQFDLLVLDGIPRSVNQAKMMERHIDVLQIVHLVACDVDEMVGRMKRRALEQGRTDDADEQVIRKRFVVYRKETAPVLKSYHGTPISEVDAIGTPAGVLLNVLKVLVPVYERHFGNPLAGSSRSA